MRACSLWGQIQMILGGGLGIKAVSEGQSHKRIQDFAIAEWLVFSHASTAYAAEYAETPRPICSPKLSPVGRGS